MNCIIQRRKRTDYAKINRVKELFENNSKRDFSKLDINYELNLSLPTINKYLIKLESDDFIEQINSCCTTRLRYRLTRTVFLY